MSQFTNIYAFMLATMEMDKGTFRVTPTERITFEGRRGLVKFNLIIDDQVEEEWVFAARGAELERYFSDLERLYS